LRVSPLTGKKYAMTASTLPTFAREDHPVGEITILSRRRATDRASALIGYKIDGLPAMATFVTRVDVVDFVAYDTAS